MESLSEVRRATKQRAEQAVKRFEGYGQTEVVKGNGWANSRDYGQWFEPVADGRSRSLCLQDDVTTRRWLAQLLINVGQLDAAGALTQDIGALSG